MARPSKLDPYKEQISTWLKEGLTPTQIKQRLKVDHGKSVSLPAITTRIKHWQSSKEDVPTTSLELATESQEEPEERKEPLFKRVITTFKTALKEYEEAIEETQEIRNVSPEKWSLDNEIINIAPDNQKIKPYPFTITDACEGIQVMGGVGSGKTSGSGKLFSEAYLSHGFGGLVLCYKNDEAEEWKEKISQAGREQDILHIRLNGEHRLNFLDYEFQQNSHLSSVSNNLVELFITLVEINSGQKQEKDFWTNSVKQLLRYSFDLLIMGDEKISILHVYKLIQNSAGSLEQASSKEWLQTSAIPKLLEKAEVKARAENRKEDYERIKGYWLQELPDLHQETRSSVIASFTTIADMFVSGEFRILFDTDTTFDPADCYREGKIIILDLSPQDYQELGRYAQILFKYVWQKAMERRKAKADGGRPVFLWIDEVQKFVTKQDADFLSASRASRVCAVFLTQNLPSYIAENNDEHRTNQMLGNLVTKIFHQNSCAKTNGWAADTIGKTILKRKNLGIQGQNSHANSGSLGYTETEGYRVMPQAFQSLKKGGKSNGYEVECIFYAGGKAIGLNDEPCFKVSLDQI